MQIARINNAPLIKGFVTQPRLYRQLREDFSPAPEDWEPNMQLGLWLMVYEQDASEIWGMYAFVPETPILYRFHPAVNPTHWGKPENRQATQMALDWVWEHTDARKIIGKVPAIYPQLLKWGQQLGFKREGIQRESFLKDGKLHDQYYMGLARENE